MNSTQFRTAVAFSVWVMTQTPAMASEPAEPLAGEREVLARIVKEIEYLKTMAHDAESQASDRNRVRFQYEWFERDLERIRQGILDYLHGPNNTATGAPPLRGDYRY
jgi:RAQPRD family integrative conjugative element protein